MSRNGRRHYAPSVGAFTQADTVQGSALDPASMNRYLYAEANPSSLIDPSGHAVAQEQLCDPKWDYCGDNATNTVNNSHPDTSKPRNGGGCGTSCGGSTTKTGGGDVDTSWTSPRPQAWTAPTMGDWTAWWRQASEADRIQMQALTFGREFADATNPAAPPDIVCLGANASSSEMCRQIQLVSTMIHSADSAWILLGVGGMTGLGFNDVPATASTATSSSLQSLRATLESVKEAGAATREPVANSGFAADAATPGEYVRLPEFSSTGLPGRGLRVRELAGGRARAEELFNQWSTGGMDITPEGYGAPAGGTLVRLPNGDLVGIRIVSRSGGPAIDITPFDGSNWKIHFNGE